MFKTETHYDTRLRFNVRGDELQAILRKRANACVAKAAKFEARLHELEQHRFPGVRSDEFDERKADLVRAHASRLEWQQFLLFLADHIDGTMVYACDFDDFTVMGIRPEPSYGLDEDRLLR